MPNWMGGGQGAVGGAMTGAALGSVVPGIGTGIGAAVGGGLGFLGGLFGDKQNPYAQRLEQFAGQPAPQMGPAAQAGTSDFRANQRRLADMLQAQAEGSGPSLAMEAANQQAERGSKAAQAAAASMRGPNVGLGAFQAMNQAGEAQNAATQAAALGRIQEQYNAQNLLGLTLHGARGADEEMGRYNATQQNLQAQANLDAQLRAMGINSSVLQTLYGGGQQPGFGEQLLAGGAGSLGFLAGQLGNQGGQGAQAPMWGDQLRRIAAGGGGQPGGPSIGGQGGAYQGNAGNPQFAWQGLGPAYNLPGAGGTF